MRPTPQRRNYPCACIVSIQRRRRHMTQEGNRDNKQITRQSPYSALTGCRGTTVLARKIASRTWFEIAFRGTTWAASDPPPPRGAQCMYGDYQFLNWAWHSTIYLHQYCSFLFPTWLVLSFSSNLTAITFLRVTVSFVFSYFFFLFVTEAPLSL